ncbi:serine hydrolase [Nocardioides euryhalodurans]|uniref:Serine hydrolase n=1 Tax=Nocardioides euryhalodurans TaxID=2518370 RepID=A0A4P7GQ62_9ACTN|nr:serine hydrolase [Nocardioides euryhalodurans]
MLPSDQLRGTSWGVEIRDLTTGRVHAAHRPEVLLRTASLGKVFLLVEVADRLARGLLHPAQLLRRDTVAPVADSGLWQHLRTDTLPLDDVARLVGAVSDNWATNVLLEEVGLAAVQQRARTLAPGGSTLHDRVRDRRTASDAATLSEGCAADWVGVLSALASGRGVGVEVGRTVLGWLSLGVDLSMVASAFALDPLAHAEPDRGLTVVNKTGTDSSLRADVGLVTGPAGTTAYAAICSWDPAGGDPRDAVMATLRGIGGLVRETVTAAGAR